MDLSTEESRWKYRSAQAQIAMANPMKEKSALVQQGSEAGSLAQASKMSPLEKLKSIEDEFIKKTPSEFLTHKKSHKKQHESVQFHELKPMFHLAEPAKEEKKPAAEKSEFVFKPLQPLFSQEEETPAANKTKASFAEPAKNASKAAFAEPKKNATSQATK